MDTFRDLSLTILGDIKTKRAPLCRASCYAMVQWRAKHGAAAKEKSHGCQYLNTNADPRWAPNLRLVYSIRLAGQVRSNCWTGPFRLPGWTCLAVGYKAGQCAPYFSNHYEPAVDHDEPLWNTYWQCSTTKNDSKSLRKVFDQLQSYRPVAKASGRVAKPFGRIEKPLAMLSTHWSSFGSIAIPLPSMESYFGAMLGSFGARSWADGITRSERNKITTRSTMLMCGSSPRNQEKNV